MTLGLQTTAAPADTPAANESQLTPVDVAPVPATPAPAAPVVSILSITPELADVLPNVIKVELMRLAQHHFGAAAGATMPLLRACREDTQSLCDVIAACAQAAEPIVGGRAAARFVDDAMHAMAQRR